MSGYSILIFTLTSVSCFDFYIHNVSYFDFHSEKVHCFELHPLSVLCYDFHKVLSCDLHKLQQFWLPLSKVNHSGNHWGIVLFWLCFSQKVLSQSLHNVLWLSQSQGTVLTFTLTFHKVKFSLLLSWFCVGLSLSQGSVFDSHSHKVVYFDFTLAVFWLLAFFVLLGFVCWLTLTRFFSFLFWFSLSFLPGLFLLSLWQETVFWLSIWQGFEFWLSLLQDNMFFLLLSPFALCWFSLL